MHVPQAGDQVTAFGVYRGSVVWIACALGADRGDAAAFDHNYLVGAYFSGTNIHHVHVRDDQGFFQIPVLLRGNLYRAKEQYAEQH